MRRLVFLLGWMVLAGTAARAGDVVAERFETFCAEWMNKLAVRERDNKAGIQWQAGPNGVQGQFIGYSQDHLCQLKPLVDPKGVPIGKITYKEYVYRQAGTSTSEAQKGAPVQVDTTEITEIFRYSAGKWVY